MTYESTFPTAPRNRQHSAESFLKFTPRSGCFATSAAFFLGGVVGIVGLSPAPMAHAQIAVNPVGESSQAGGNGLVAIESGLGNYGANTVSQRYIDPGNSAFVRPMLYAVGSDAWSAGQSGLGYGTNGDGSGNGFGASIHGPRVGLGANINGGYTSNQGWYLFTEPGVRMMTRQPVDGTHNGVSMQGIGADSYFDLSPLGLNAAPAMNLAPASPQAVYWEQGVPPWATSQGLVGTSGPASSANTANMANQSLGSRRGAEPTADQILVAIERRREAAIARVISATALGQRIGEAVGSDPSARNAATTAD